MITECADKLAHLGEKLFKETEMKYRAGDKVRIKSLDWYNKNKGMNGLVGLFTPSMKRLCGKVVTLDSAYNGKYTAIEKEAKGYYLDDSMIEGLAEFSEDKLLEKLNDAFKKVDEEMDARYKKAKAFCDGDHWSTEFECPDGYEFHDENGNVIEAKMIMLEKKPRYPKTYEECSKIAPMTWGGESFKYYNDLLSSFYKLVICRDAFWKIAGEEMGLGRPWKPNWDKCNGIKYCIYPILNSIRYDAMANEEYENRILAFPTEEMRDAFYENFSDLIEECKELL